MTETPYVPIPEPAQHGEEFLRAAIDSDGQLVLSLASGPLQSDARLWGCALADIALEAAKHHTVNEMVNTTNLERAWEENDKSDFRLTMALVRQAFIDEVETGCDPGVVAVTAVHPDAFPDMVEVGVLRRGDRFVIGDDLFLVLDVISQNSAANLATGEVRRFSADLRVHPVRRKSD